jgi:pullulanase
VKGELHGPALGYGNGGAVDLEDLILLLKGSPNVFESPTYSMNYVECHDNMTLFDKILKDTRDHEHARTYQDFTNALITLSAGIAFFHAGQEMYRSKKGVENSYQSSDDINQLQYNLGPHIDVFKQFI